MIKRLHLFMPFMITILLVRGALAQEPTVIIDDVSLSDFPTLKAAVTVVNAGRVPIRNLNPNQFKVLEDQQHLAEVTVDVGTPSDAPLAIALVLDLSGSAPLTHVQQAAQQFLETLQPQDRVALIGFNDVSNPDLNFFDPFKEAAFTTNHALISEIVEGLSTLPKSAVYEAILKGVALTVNERTTRRAVLVMSDGQDIDSRPEIATADDPETLARQENIPIFTVGIPSLEAALPANLDYLSALASKTGGQYQEVTDLSNMGLIFEQVSGQLREQYQLTFQATGRQDGQSHQLTIQVQNPDGAGLVEAQVTVAYPEPPEIPEIRGIQRDVNGQLQPLIAHANLQGNILLVPDINAKYPIAQVDYHIHDRVITIIPHTVSEPQYQAWEVRLKANQYQAGLQQLTVTVADEAGHVGPVFELPIQITHVPQLVTPTAITAITPLDEATSTSTTFNQKLIEFAQSPWAIGLIIIIILLLCLIGLAIYLAWQDQANHQQTEPPPTVMESWETIPPPDSGTNRWQPQPAPNDDPPVQTEMPPQQPDLPAAEAPSWGSGTAKVNGSSLLDEYELSREEKTEILFATTSMPITGLLVVQEAIGNLTIGQTFPLAEPEITLGRSDDNLITLKDNSVSRQHAKIRLEGGTFHIQDLQSANGTKVNGEKVKQQRLHENDRLQLGRVRLIFITINQKREKGSA